MNLSKFDEIKAYEENWDGEGALKPSIDAITTAENICKLLKIKQPDAIVAGLHGEIFMEWYLGPDRIVCECNESGIDLMHSDKSRFINVLKEWGITWGAKNAAIAIDCEYQSFLNKKVP